jgi:hypothetical protein
MRHQSVSADPNTCCRYDTWWRRAVTAQVEPPAPPHPSLHFKLALDTARPCK